jgi:hypothetical protein
MLEYGRKMDYMKNETWSSVFIARVSFYGRRNTDAGQIDTAEDGETCTSLDARPFCRFYEINPDIKGIKRSMHTRLSQL